MSITSQNDICNLAASFLGDLGQVNDIDSPETSIEQTFALWYDVTRQQMLRMTIPNFAQQRRRVPKLDVNPAFGYRNVYEYPADALRVLGFGEIDEKSLDYTIEGRQILTDMDYEEGLPLRFVRDVTDVSLMSADYQILFAMALAINVGQLASQKTRLVAQLRSELPGKISEVSGTAAQENPPIRISNSKFKAARHADQKRNNPKR